MYNEYESFVNNIVNNFSNFKTDTKYNAILEHVSENQGYEYVSLIEFFLKENFTQITFDNINDYLLLNDKYGNPKKYLYTIFDNKVICSPSSLRYVYHALIILKYIKYNNSKKIVEVGCGYGGLFLAINRFSKILEISLDKYYLIDLPVVCNLINVYLQNHSDIHINYILKSAYNYGEDIDDDNLFFISNYCFTEINNEYRNLYISKLFPKVKNGFIIWQTVFGLPIFNTNIIGKEITKIVEETPQTASITNKNYFVYF
jgi:putative sugar O-methyltransferase